MKNMLERLREARAARQENREAGFSLIELIVVIAIIGILIAVAIPVYGNIQQRGANNQLKNAAATVASEMAAAIAANNATTDPLPTSAGKTNDDITYTITGTTLSTYCVTAVPKSTGALSAASLSEAKAGPCPATP